MKNQETFTLANGDKLILTQSRNIFGKLKWRWAVRAKGNHEMIGDSQKSGFHNRIDCLKNFERLGQAAFGFQVFGSGVVGI